MASWLERLKGMAAGLVSRPSEVAGRPPGRIARRNPGPPFPPGGGGGRVLHSPLGDPICRHEPAAVRALLAAGADVDGAGIGTFGPLHAAAKQGSDDLVRLLVDAGAALDVTHPDFGTPLTAALGHRRADTAGLLLDLGVPPELPNGGGAQALHIAAYAGDLPMVRRLLEHPRVDPDARTYAGGTPLRAAAAAGHVEVVRLLVERGADPAPVDAFDRRPVDDARDAGHAEVVALLEGTPPRPAAPPRRYPRRAPLAQHLPERGDATLSGVIHGLRTANPVVRSSVSALEAPSMMAVVRTLQAAWEFTCRLDIDPDPRVPCRPVGLQLWHFEVPGVPPAETAEAVAAVPTPPEALAATVGELAAGPYLLRVWSRRAATVARGVGPEALAQVLACMVHPPPCPIGFEPWDWVFRVQVAAGLLASHLGAEPWPGSARQAALEDVAFGPADWACTAAVMALLDVARREPAWTAEVRDTLWRLVNRPANATVYQHVVRPAAWAMHDLGLVGPEEARVLEQLMDEPDGDPSPSAA